MKSATEDKPAELTALHAAVDDFLHAAVHDIRGPLGQVRSLVVLLERQHKGSLNEDGQELCGLIEAAARRAIEVVESIHTYAQVLEAPLFDAADLNAIADAARFAVQPAVDHTGAIITRDDLPSVHGDRAKLLMLFQELFQNALKFRGNAPTRIHCSATGASQDGGQWIQFSVTDNGEGIPDKDSEAVFKPLKRLHGRAREGSGMGLAICRRIVEAHGGKIWVEAQSDGGSDFRFTLPALRD